MKESRVNHILINGIHPDCPLADAASGPIDEIVNRQMDKLRKHNDAIASGQTRDEGKT
jgi:hypothetical protein